MQAFALRVGLGFVLVTAAGCADLPTGTDAPTAGAGAPNEAYAPLEPDECDPWWDVNWCEDPGDPGEGDCLTSVSAARDGDATIQGCGPGGGPGGGGDPTPVVPEDTCRTGDPVFDDPAVQTGLQDLWNRSNPDAPQDQRLEQAGWIIEDADGSHRIEAFSITTQGPCGINGNFNAPQGAIAWVHTHPFTVGEEQRICGALKQPDPATGGWKDVVGADGRPIYPVYDGRPSIPDRELMSDVNFARELVGREPLAGVIIDANKTTVYTEYSTDEPTELPRCGY